MSTELDLSLAPGCYGNGLLFDAAAAVCGACPFVGRCGPEGAQRLAASRERLGLVPPPSNELRSLMQAIECAGINVVEALRCGQNPFQRNPQFLRIACHLLLRKQDGVSRDVLARVFEQRLGWSGSKARQHALVTMQFMQAVGATFEFQDAMYVRKA
jgi:hypothetical protein